MGLVLCLFSASLAANSIRSSIEDDRQSAAYALETDTALGLSPEELYRGRTPLEKEAGDLQKKSVEAVPGVDQILDDIEEYSDEAAVGQIPRDVIDSDKQDALLSQ